MIYKLILIIWSSWASFVFANEQQIVVCLQSLVDDAQYPERISLELHQQYSDLIPQTREIFTDIFADKTGKLAFRPKSVKSIESKLVGTKRIKNNFSSSEHLVTDGVGVRLVLDNSSQVAIDSVVQRMVGAILDGKLKLKVIKNYRGEDGVAYFNQVQLQKLVNAINYTGGEVKVLTGDQAIKSFGYTAVQMKVELPRGVLGEFQIRGREIDKIAHIEHFFYDLRQLKGVAGNASPEKVKIAESFLKLSDSEMEQYRKYINSYYKQARQKELNPFKEFSKPQFPKNWNDEKSVLSVENIKFVLDHRSN